MVERRRRNANGMLENSVRVGGTFLFVVTSFLVVKEAVWIEETIRDGRTAWGDCTSQVLPSSTASHFSVEGQDLHNEHVNMSDPQEIATRIWKTGLERSRLLTRTCRLHLDSTFPQNPVRVHVDSLRFGGPRSTSASVTYRTDWAGGKNMMTIGTPGCSLGIAWDNYGNDLSAQCRTLP